MLFVSAAKKRAVYIWGIPWMFFALVLPGFFGLAKMTEELSARAIASVASWLAALALFGGIGLASTRRLRREGLAIVVDRPFRSPDRFDARAAAFFATQRTGYRGGVTSIVVLGDDAADLDVVADAWSFARARRASASLNAVFLEPAAWSAPPMRRGAGIEEGHLAQLRSGRGITARDWIVGLLVTAVVVGAAFIYSIYLAP